MGNAENNRYDGDKVRCVRGIVLEIDEHGLVQMDAWQKLILLAIDKLLRIEDCVGNKETFHKHMEIGYYGK